MGVSMSVDFRASQIAAGMSFDLNPDTAIAYFRAKGLKASFAWQDMLGAEHTRAFTVAKMMDLDMLDTVRQAMDKAIADGTDFRAFREELTPILQAAGWWGKKDVVDPLTGETIEAQLGSAWRLETIFRTNMQNAYATGAWQGIQRYKSVAPFLLYDAIDDSRTRPEHARWDGKVFPADSRFWRDHFPPNGWNCRCGTIQLTQRQLDRMGLEPSPDPDIPTEAWTNPRTGKTYQVPVDLDPGWDYNPGAESLSKTQDLLAEKIAAMPEDMATAAKASLAVAAEREAAAQASAVAAGALKDLAKTVGPAELQSAQQKTAARAAQSQLNDIAEEQTPYLWPALKALEKTKKAAKLTAVEKLAIVKEKAAKAEQNAALADFKAAFLKGKAKPSAKAQAVFDALPSEAQTSITAELLQKKADLDATKAATEKLTKIAAGEAEDPGKFLAAAHKQLSAIPGYENGTPTEQLAAVEAKAKQLKAHHKAQTAMSGMKQNIAVGLVPTSAQLSAFNSLPIEEQDAYGAKFGKAKQQVDDWTKLYTDYNLWPPSLDEKKTFYKLKAKDKAAAIKKLEDDLDDIATGGPVEPQAETPSIEKPAAPAGLVEPEDWTNEPLVKTGAQRGSNAGGFYKNTDTGTDYYIKTPKNEDIARNELLAQKLYKLAGVDVPELTLISRGGETSIASRIIADTRQDARALTAGPVPGAQDNFIFDAWLANWDSVGLNYDNLVLDASGRAIRIDVGGALRYRAQGELKGRQFGDTVSELQTLLDGTNSQTASVFRYADDRHIAEAVRRLAAIDDVAIMRLVDAYGPRADSDRAALSATLLARRQFILDQYPEALAQANRPADTLPDATKEFLTETELVDIEDSRGNGVARPSDGDDIEDQQILIWQEQDEAGTTKTRAYLKLRGNASRNLMSQAGGADTAAPADTGADDGGTLQSLTTAIKGIAMQSQSEGVIRDKDVQRANEAEAKFLAHWQHLSDTDPKAAQSFMQHYRPWVRAIRRAVSDGEGSPAKWAAPTEAHGALLHAWAPPQTAQPEPEQGIQWTRGDGSFYESDIKNGNITRKQTVANKYGYTYEATLPGGVTARYWPDAEGVPFALRNRLELTADGKSIDGGPKLEQALDAIGVDSKRATDAQQEELYLRRISYHARDGFREVESGANAIADDSQRLAYLRQAVSKQLGVDDITQQPDYDYTGKHQAFGHGRRHQYRPMSGRAWEAFRKDYRLHHTLYAGDPVKALDLILNSGGQMAPTTEKLRRGIPIGGMSPEADLNTGGASYFFTRIKRTANAERETGLIWKPDALARLDAISYPGDYFGKVKGDTVISERKTGIKEWKEAARQGSNETILKDGISIFDDLDRIKLRTSKQLVDAIEVFHRHGIYAWPDGRTLEEVIRL